MADTKKPSMSQLRKKLKKIAGAGATTKPTASQLQQKYKKTTTEASTKPVEKVTKTKIEGKKETTTEIGEIGNVTKLAAKPEPTASSKVTYRPPRVKKKDIQFLPAFSKAQKEKIAEGKVQDPNSSDSLKKGEFRDHLALYLDAMTTKQIQSMAKKYKVADALIAKYAKLANNGLKRMNTGNTIRKAINAA
jgi:hypothetical protein